MICNLIKQILIVASQNHREAKLHHFILTRNTKKRCFSINISSSVKCNNAFQTWQIIIFIKIKKAVSITALRFLPTPGRAWRSKFHRPLSTIKYFPLGLHCQTQQVLQQARKILYIYSQTITAWVETHDRIGYAYTNKRNKAQLASTTHTILQNL